MINANQTVNLRQDFSEEGLLECIKALVRLEETYIPSAPNSLYLRPTMYGTRETLGMGGSMDEATIVVL
jgi:branched-subunit amino acid aminotransferase/4-amino-4-deoxychorismate lyase